MTVPTAYGHDLRTPRAIVDAALSDAAPRPFWLDDPSRPAPRPALRGDRETDLVVVGGGYCGLWTALIAKERDPQRRVILLEGQRIAWSASGRNGGFVEPSLTHGPENGELHFADEIAEITALETENFEALDATLTRYGIDAEWEETGILTVATEPHQLGWLEEAAAADSGHGHAEYLTGDALATKASSPLFRAGLFAASGAAYVHPAKLAWGLAEAAEGLGVEIHEHSPAIGLKTTAEGVVITTPDGEVRAARVALATNVFPSLLPSRRLFTVPVYDYVLMTEPLSAEQLESIGWTGRYGITDSSREFHYYRKTADDRILFGGYDAVYHRGGRVRRSQDQRPETFRRLADHFLLTFPQLSGIRFTHAWGGAIDMSTQLVAFHGVAKGGRVAYSAGYTGLGVAATRFGAETMLDLLAGADTPRTRLKMARRLPVPIPPEPFAYPLIQTMRHAVAASDANGGKDGPLLKLAGLFGVGFDS
ncbi:Gamma-glutamylputrescine oxidoreductase [Microbacterium lemovicicum]|uniref:Gamma-glutamylputrescine oxidoreductase n=1 Tax=Microbacterium lemovicicum TaxID=1072463 RepID=A0A3Q9J0I6_9MICO|nr:FAD-dependent oxidoreductase [Microbacterium lemovicicum]AZS38061.1 Gamma-glutamylputrescine oxidoreductase [Microbacterium lemovicicum]